MIHLRFTTSDAVGMTPAEISLYGGMDRIRQAMNSSIRRFVNEHRELLAGRVLDYGAGKVGTCRIPQPFRTLINARDYVPWEPDDPYLDASTRDFEGILCTQVIQNCEDPFRTFRLFADLLQKGGHLVVTYPVMWEPIEEEFWRFTPKGLWLLCHKAGLKIVRNDILSMVSLDGCLTLPMAGGVVAVKV